MCQYNAMGFELRLYYLKGAIIGPPKRPICRQSLKIGINYTSAKKSFETGWVNNTLVLTLTEALVEMFA